MRNFHSFIGIDWSGAKYPVRTPSISVAQCVCGQSAPPCLVYPAGSLRWSRGDIYIHIKELAENSQNRTLIGIDANFGYAQAIGEKNFGKNYDFRDVWAAVEQTNTNYENFFAGGFWAHPRYGQDFWTSGKKPIGFEMPKRLVETTCGQSGLGWPESPFKLIGAKQVGKGGLAAMRMAYHLKDALGDDIAIWPFEHELAAERAKIVMAEIYPRQFLHRFGHGHSKVRKIEDLNGVYESAGVEAVSAQRKLSDHDTDALVSAAGLRHMCGEGEYLPESLAWPPMLDDQRALREGWIFGVGYNPDE